MYARKMIVKQSDIFKENIAKFENNQMPYAFYQCQISTYEETYYFNFLLFRDNILFPLDAIIVNDKHNNGDRIDDYKLLNTLTKLVLLKYGSDGWE